ncbi:MAG TPA: ScpA family protein, partial [Pirellulaceae bacterium]
DFLDIASQLIEMKSRALLPHTDEIPEEVIDDPSDALVQHLLEYKKYRDVASLLEERAQEWQQTYPRLGHDLPPRLASPETQPIREVELWDLVSALGRVMREQEIQNTANIVYDETPIQTYIKAVYERLSDRGEVALTDLLRMGMSKSAVIGLFLAVLELVRHHSVEAEQEDGSVEIVVRPGPNFGQPLDDSRVDNYEDAAPSKS